MVSAAVVKKTTIDSSHTALECKGLVKSFAKHVVLKGVDFSISSGEAVAFVGSNGSGKSTLLRAILHLIEPDEGVVNLLGEEINSLRGRELKRARRKVGFIFQKHNLVPRLSALSNTMHGAAGASFEPLTWYQGFAPADLRRRALECLGKVGMEGKAMCRVDTLSGGQSQKVAIARALMQQPQMIFADEPVASLDPSAGEEVMELLLRLNRELGVTLLFVSHNVDHALAYSDRVLGLKKGEIVLDEHSDNLSNADLRGFYE